MRWKPVRRTLGVGAFGVNAYAADAGQQVVEDHDETGSGAGGHEELYVVMRGHARFTLDGDDVEAPAGGMFDHPRPGQLNQPDDASAPPSGWSVVPVT